MISSSIRIFRPLNAGFITKTLNGNLNKDSFKIIIATIICSAIACYILISKVLYSNKKTSTKEDLKKETKKQDFKDKEEKQTVNTESENIVTKANTEEPAISEEKKHENFEAKKEQSFETNVEDKSLEKEESNCENDKEEQVPQTVLEEQIPQTVLEAEIPKVLIEEADKASNKEIIKSETREEISKTEIKKEEGKKLFEGAQFAKIEKESDSKTMQESIEVEKQSLDTEKNELEIIKQNARCNPDHIIQISLQDYEELKQSLKDAGSEINLDRFAVTGSSGNIFFCSRAGFQVYTIATVLSKKHSHPLLNTDYYSIRYIEPTDDAFSKVMHEGCSIPGIKNGAIAIDESKLIEALEENALSKFSKDSKIVMLSQKVVNDLKNNVESAKNAYIAKIKKQRMSAELKARALDRTRKVKKEPEKPINVSKFNCYKIETEYISNCEDCEAESDDIMFYVTVKKDTLNTYGISTFFSI